jgi:XTP/dITP diphosphohydrolase
VSNRTCWPGFGRVAEPPEKRWSTPPIVEIARSSNLKAVPLCGKWNPTYGHPSPLTAGHDGAWLMSKNERVIVLGTHNRKKGLELAALFAPFGFELRTLVDFPAALQVEEVGQTFAENARIKACCQAEHLQQWVLGEDSGLSVDALHGKPGVYSARFSGPNATDDTNNQKLLALLQDVPADQRGAQYVCHCTLSDPSGTARADAEARCRGRIAPAPRGSAGFGYDPVFEILEYHRTFGQLGDAVKSILSHRGRAVRMILPQIMQIVRQGLWT